MHITNIFIVGAGRMGSGIAETAALAGFQVTMYDVGEAEVHRGVDAIKKSLERQINKGRKTQSEAQDILDNIKVTVLLDDAKNADLVIEAVFEDIAVKQKLFKELEHVCADSAILASNTSSISITEIAKHLKNPKRAAGLHFFNPVPIMKLVEVIKGEKTDQKVIDALVFVGETMGKIPVICKDSPGFLVNRMLIPMLNEAILLLQNGIAAKEDIDNAAIYGLNHPMGPLKLADSIGLDVVLAIMNVLESQLGAEKYSPCALLTQMVEKGKLGVKTKEGFYTYN